MTDAFAGEMRVFNARREDWNQSHPGEWVAIRGDEILSFYSDSDAAWHAAIDSEWRPGTFLLKRVTPKDEPIVVSHIELPD